MKNAAILASIASVALAHSHHGKRQLPANGNIITSCTVAGDIALTFDDGPYIYTQEIVDKLTAAGHRATFFQNGQNWDSIYNYAGALTSMIAGGHQVASHTWDHADLATLDAAGITSEMTQLEAAHLALIGKIPTYMRPPFLSTNELVLTTVAGLGYKIIEVDIDTQDWAEGPIGQIQLSIDWYEGNLTAGGSISLNHDPYQPTAETFVPAIITYLASKGLKSVPVGECLGDDPANWYKGGSGVTPSSSAGLPSGSPTSSAGGNGTIGGSPTKSGSAPGGPSPTKGPSAGDTEPGHGPNSGHGALPGHAGHGNDGAPNTTAGAGSPGSPGHPTNGSATAKPTYYVNSASSLTGSALVFGFALFALLL